MSKCNCDFRRWAATITASVLAQAELFEMEDEDSSSLPRLLCVWDDLTRMICDRGYFQEFIQADLNRIYLELAQENYQNRHGA